MLPYALEIPEVSYDRVQLMQIARTLKPEMAFFQSKAGTTDGHKVLLLTEDHCARFPYINALMDSFLLGALLPQPALLQFLPHIGINLHVDDGRGCVLQFPLTPDAGSYAPIEWHENGTRSHQHRYRTDCPTLVNTQRPHLVVNTNTMRIAFQIGLRNSFEEVVELYNQKKLINAHHQHGS